MRGGVKMSILKIKNLCRYYGNDENQVKAVNGIDLDIERGKITSIMGKSGSGKSTLLHCIAGLDSPTGGEVVISDRNIYTLSDDELSDLRRKKFGFIFQDFKLIPIMNVYDNIILPVRLDKGDIDKKYIDEIIVRLGLEKQLKKLPNEISGGQKQRVAIARALSNKPDIIFADEPTGNLDSKTSEEVLSVLKDVVKMYKKTLVLITHDESIARQTDRIITISDGKIEKDEIIR